MKTTASALAIFCSMLLLPGCGESKPATQAAANPSSPAPTGEAAPKSPPAAPKASTEKPTVTPAPGAPPPAPVAPPEPAAKRLEAKEFQAKLAEIQKLEADGKFADAFKACSDLQVILGSDARGEQVDDILKRIREEKRATADLSFALKNLVSSETDTAQIAERKFTDAGDSGLIVLRQAVRNEDDAIATRAAQLLAQLHDQKAAPALTERLLKTPPEPLQSALIEALQESVEQLDPALLARIYASTKDDKDFKQRAAVGLIASAYEKVWKQNADAANTALGDEHAVENLKKYVEAAGKSSDAAVVAWSSSAAAQLGMFAHGLHGYYFEGDNFEKLVHEQLDEKIDVPDRKFPMPGGREDHISARWTGTIQIEKPGKYTFFSTADDGHRMWIDGKPVTDDWGYHGFEERSGEIELTAGPHDFKVEYMQGEGGAAIRVEWKGPDFERKVITSEVLRTPPFNPKKD